ncbi:hypothetical protein GN956_G22180 [Arapaima gigas]
MNRKNNRDNRETFSGEHLSLKDLKDKHLENGYLWNEVTLLPMPVEFHVPRVVHVTDSVGVWGILTDKGFQVNCDSRAKKGWGFLWWSLFISQHDIEEAERWFLIRYLPGWRPKQDFLQKPFLDEFATSPAFQEGSRYGNFKFTFPLSVLLQQYSKQFCSGRKPLLRVFETVVYKQEILYSVLIHDPYDNSFEQYPVLADRSDSISQKPDDSICGLKGYHFIWKAWAISTPCKFILDKDRESNTVSTKKMPREKYYVWQNVALAFHVPQADKEQHGSLPLEL